MLKQDVIDSAGKASIIEADSRCSVALRIHVYQEHFAICQSQSGSKIHGGSGLTHSALLVRHRNDSSHKPPCVPRETRPARVSRGTINDAGLHLQEGFSANVKRREIPSVL